MSGFRSSVFRVTFDATMIENFSLNAGLKFVRVPAGKRSRTAFEGVWKKHTQSLTPTSLHASSRSASFSRKLNTPPTFGLRSCSLVLLRRLLGRGVADQTTRRNGRHSNWTPARSDASTCKRGQFSLVFIGCFCFHSMDSITNWVSADR